MNALASSTGMEPGCGRQQPVAMASGGHAVGMRINRPNAPTGLPRRRDASTASVQALPTSTPTPSPRHSRNAGPSSAEHPSLQSAQSSLLLHAAPASDFNPSHLPRHHSTSLPRPLLPSFPPARPAAFPSSKLNQLIKDTTSWPELAALVQQQQHHFNFIHVSAAITHLAQLLNPSSTLNLSNTILSPAARSSSSSPSPALLPTPTLSPSPIPRPILPASDPEDYAQLMDSLLLMVRAHMHLFGARQAANTLWALSHLHPTHPGCLPLMSTLLPLTRSLFPWCEPQHLSNSLWAAAHAGLFLEDAWVEAFLDCSEAALARFAPQHLANTAWALASLGIAPDAAWWAALFARVDVLLPALAPVDVSQLLYSRACLGLRPQDPEQAALVARVYGRLMQRGGPPAGGEGGAEGLAPVVKGLEAGAAPGAQCISNTLWALATMGVMPSKAWAAEVFIEVEATLEEFKPQELSNLLWAAATLGLALPPSLVHKLYKHTKGQLDSFPAQALSNTLWALATLYPPALFSSTASGFGPAPRARPDAPLCAPPAPWTAAFLAAFHSSLPSMSAQNTSNTMWALATLGLTPAPALVSAVIQHLHGLDREAARAGDGEAEGVSAQALANCLWALASMGFKLGGQAGQLVVELVKRQLQGREPAAAPAAPARRWARGWAAERPKAAVAARPRPAPAPGSGFKGAELAEVIVALGKLGHPLPRYTEDLLLAAVLQRLPPGTAGPAVPPRCSDDAYYMTGRDVSRTLSGLAALSAAPDLVWRARFWDACCALLPTLGCLELSQLVYGLAKMQWNPVQGRMQRRALAPAPAVVVAPAAGRRARGARRLALPAMRPLQFAAPAPELAAAAAAGVAGAAGDAGGRSLMCHTVHTLPPAHLPRRRVRVARYLSWLRNQRAAGSQLRNQGGAGRQWALRLEVRRAARSLARLDRLQLQVRRQLPAPPTVEGSDPSAPSGADASRSAGSSTSTSGGSSGMKGPQGLDQLLGSVGAALPAAPSASFAHLAWGLAQMGVQPGQEWCGGVLAELLVRRCSQMHGKDLVTCLWALGRMGYRPKPRSLVLVEAALFKRLPAMKPRELAAAAWAFAAMHYTPDLEWLDAFAQQCMLVVAEFTMQDWMVVVRCLANIVEQEQDAVIYLEDLFISPQLEAQVHKFSPSALAACVHSCGVLGTKSARMLGRLLATARPKLALFSTQELTAIICTTARLGIMPEPGFLTAWLSAFESRIPEARGPTLAAVAWALATLGIKPREAWQAGFAAALSSRCAQVSPKHVSMLVWALSEWSAELAPGLVRQLGALVERGLPGYDRVVRRNMSWAMMKIKSKARRGAAREQRRVARERRLEEVQREAGVGGGKEVEASAPKVAVAGAGGSGGRRKVDAAKGFR